jgi:regulatory protein
MPHAVPLARPPSTMKIVSIEKASRADDRVRLRLDTGEQVELARELLLNAAVREGDSVQAARLEELGREDLRWRARQAALRLLAHRPRTGSELRSRLMRKGFEAELVERCLADLRAKGLLDDAAFAEMFARDRMRLNPRAGQRVVQELRGRGVEAATAAAAVEGVMREEETDELTLARDAARRWRPRAEEERDRARRRLAGFLARRGFGAEAARQVVDETLPER